MSNTTIKVTPGSRGNFSKLRKFSQGGVPKYQTAATGSKGIQRRYTNVGYTAGDNRGWSDTIFTPNFQEQLLGELNNPNTSSERRQQIVGAINDMQKAYESLRKDQSMSSPVEFHKKVQEYQQAIIDKYPFVNTEGITNGKKSGRYVYAPKVVSGDNDNSGNGNWGTDGLWGAQTHDRTVLGYTGDWDENGDRFKNINEILNPYGYRVSLGLDGDNTYTDAYYINPFNPNTEGQVPPVQNPQNPQNPENPENPGQPVIEHDVLDFQAIPDRERDPWTDWIPLSHQLANDLINNKYQYDQEVKKKFPLQEPGRREAVVTDNYAARQERQKLAGEVRSRANRNLTSDAITNLQIQDSADNQAQQLEEQNAVDKTQEFNTSLEKVQATANWNNEEAKNKANLNTQQNNLAWNNILAARQKRSASDLASINSYIGNMYTSHGQWKQNEQMEDNRYARDVQNFKYQQAANDLYTNSGLETLESPDGYLYSNAYNILKQELENDVAGDYDIIDEEGNISDDKIAQWISENPDDSRVAAFERNFTKEKQNLNTYYEAQLRKLQADRTLATLPIRSTSTNQGIYRRPARQTASPLFAKQGTKVSRFVDYLEHYRKNQKDVYDANHKSQKMIQDKLNRDLGYLDKETLMILKAAFK